MVDSPFTTPKRKRSEMLSDDALRLNTTTQFTFDVNSAAEDGNASPRTRVAHRFRGLALGSGGGGNGPQAESGAIDNDAEDSSRKRIKLPDVEMPDADSPSVIGLSASLHGSPSGRRPSLKSAHVALDDAVVSQSETVAHTGTDDDDDDDDNVNVNDNDDNNTKTDKESNLTPTTLLNPPSPSPIITSQPPHPQPRTKKQRAPWKTRAGTPPFPARSKSLPSSETTTAATGSTTTTTTITDPLRASLTWQDDEITIYDPDDSDDDGTGINGIGFKPTPAIAYARAVRRRQQLAEYRKREEREARAKRSARRRAGGGGAGSLAPEGARLLAGDVLSSGAVKKAKAERRKVRFLEREGAEMIGV